MTRQDRDTQAVYDFLTTYGPHSGTGKEAAEEIGIEYWRWARVIQRVRTEMWIAEHSWTITYVGHGGKKGMTYAVVHTRAEVPELLGSVQTRGTEMRGVIRRVYAQCSLGSHLADGHEGRWFDAAVPQLGAMVALADFLGLDEE